MPNVCVNLTSILLLAIVCNLVLIPEFLIARGNRIFLQPDIIVFVTLEFYFHTPRSFRSGVSDDNVLTTNSYTFVYNNRLKFAFDFSVASGLA